MPTMITSASRANAIRPPLASGAATTAADEVPAMIRQINAILPAGTLGRVVRSGGVAGRARKAPRARIAATAVTMTKALRQSP